MSHLFKHKLAGPPSPYHGQVLSLSPKITYLTFPRHDSKNYFGEKQADVPDNDKALTLLGKTSSTNLVLSP